jgi:hypothetical protein
MAVVRGIMVFRTKRSKSPWVWDKASDKVGVVGSLASTCTSVSSPLC